MAVTEACTNVVVHAYDEDAGMLEVEMLADEDGLTIVVRDHGAGIQPRPARSEPPALGLGLPLIAALSDAFELRGSAGQGTEVRMTFALRRARDPADANPVTGNVGADGRWDPKRPSRPQAARRQGGPALGWLAPVSRHAWRNAASLQARRTSARPGAARRARACGRAARAPWTRSGAPAPA